MTDRPDHDARDPAFDESALGASYERLQGVFEQFRDADAEIAGTLDSMRNRVMDIVHRESVLGPTTELSTPSGLRFEMLTATIRQIIRDAADQEPGFVARRVRVDVDEARSSAGAAPLAVQVSVTIRHDISVPAVDAEIRSRIARAVGDLVGCDLASLEIQVEDIHDL